VDKIDELLTRRVEKIYPNRQTLEKVLRSGKKLRLYQGFDPTGTKLHIGHMIGLMKLREFQDLGHQVIFLIGDGTGQAGDPSGKTKARGKFLSREELRANAKNYVMQASKIVRFSGKNPAEILYNSDWLNKLNLVEILNLAQNFSLQRLEERDLYEERKKRNETINLREFLYPLLQAYDSVKMNVDLELGGTDQTFNMLCGRTLVKNILHKEKFVITTPLLTDSQGKKIGKTEGNVIAITATPDEFFGMIMNLADDCIIPCFELITNIPMTTVNQIKKDLKAGKNPMIYKKQLAFTLIKMLHGDKKAKQGQEYFEKVFQGKKPPEKIKSLKTKTGKRNLVDLLVELKMASSKSEAKRLVKQAAVEINNKTIKEYDNITIKTGDIIKVGKKRWVRISE